MPYVPTGFDMITRAASALDYTNQTERLCALSAVDLLRVTMATMGGDWDVYPDQLSEDQIEGILADASNTLKPDFVETAHGLRPNGLK